MVEALFEQDGLDILGGQENDGLLQHRKHHIPFGVRKKPNHHWIHFGACQGHGIQPGGHCVCCLDPSHPDRADQCGPQFVMAASCTLHNVAGPGGIDGIARTGKEVSFNLVGYGRGAMVHN